MCIQEYHIHILFVVLLDCIIIVWSVIALLTIKVNVLQSTTFLGSCGLG